MDKVDDDLFSPEGRELTRKRARLKLLEDTLIEQEDRLAARRSEVLSFERHYFHEVGPRYERRDELLAELGKLLLESAADGSTSVTVAGVEPRIRSGESEASLQISDVQVSAYPSPPTPELRDLYRQLARRVHPDLADGEEERTRRHAVMAEVNIAYERGDVEALQMLLAAEVHAPEKVQGEGIGAELIRVIRRMDRVEGGLRKVAKGLKTLGESEIGKLFEEAMQARQAGVDLLAQLAARLDQEIAELSEKIQNPTSTAEL